MTSLPLPTVLNHQPMNEENEFQKAARETDPGFFSELWDFLRTNKKWWLIPIILLLLIFGVAVFFSGTGLAPFIYTFF